MAAGDLHDRLGGARSSLAFKAPVRVATTANIVLSGFQTIDGILPTENDANLRILVKNQDDPVQNGIYEMQSGNWRRTKDHATTEQASASTTLKALSSSTCRRTMIIGPLLHNHGHRSVPFKCPSRLSQTTSDQIVYAHLRDRVDQSARSLPRRFPYLRTAALGGCGGG